MRFLRLLLWLLVGLLAALFLGRNWGDVTVDLWGNLQADIKLPLLLVIAFLLGWLPTSILWRSRVWRMKRAQLLATHQAAATPVAPAERAPIIIDDFTS
jgi:putative membrane protein